METPRIVPRIVIVGGGFAGILTAKGLAKAPARITLVDRSNYHLFQPLLYQVATAALSPAEIAAPIRAVLSRQKNTEVLLGEVTGVDVAQKRVRLADRELPYDYLVLATGAGHSYFGHPEWEKHAPGLKSIPDATRIRERILIAFERAEMESDEAKRQALLTFVIVGGGPTGVEMAGSIAELAHRALASDFRHIDPLSTQILLIEAGPRLLAAFPEDLSAKALKKLQDLAVDVRVSSRVESVTEDGVVVSGQKIESKTVIWAAGVVASPAGRWLGVPTDRAGRVHVAPDLSIPGHPEISVLGDTALVISDGKPVPGVAPAAMQEGRYTARRLKSLLAGKKEFPAFRYVDKGNLATIGRSAAVADLGKIHLSGWIAWVAWLVVHIYYLITFRNRLAVLMDWAWAYFTFQRGARLITREEE